MNARLLSMLLFASAVLLAAMPALAGEEATVDVRVRWITGAEAGVTDAVPGGAPGALRPLAKADALRLLQRVRRGDLRVDRTLRLTLQDGSPGEVEDLVQHAYIGGFEVRRDADDPTRVVADPQVETYEEGLAVKLEPHLASDGRQLRLEGVYRVRGVQAPIRIRLQRVEGLEEPLRAQQPVPVEYEGSFQAVLPTDGYGVIAEVLDPRVPNGRGLLLFDVRSRPATPAPTPDVAQGAVDVEARVVRMPPSVASGFFPSLGGEGQDTTTVVDDSLVQSLLADARVEVLSAPRVLVEPGEKAEVRILAQTRYVKDYEVEITRGETLLTPVVETIQDGVVLEVEASPIQAGVDLSVRATLADLKRPVAEFETEVAGQRVTIQIPELRVVRARGRDRVWATRWLALGPVGEHEGRPRYVLVKARVRGEEPPPAGVKPR